jgi:hypothetical protein
MRNILRHGPRFGALLLLLPALVFVVSLFWRIGPAPAQVQVYSYAGQGFNPSNCKTDGTHTFEPGYVTGTLILTGLASGYSGTINSPSSNVALLSMTGNGVGVTVDLNSALSPSYGFQLSNGQITSWGVVLETVSSDHAADTSGTVGGTGNDFSQDGTASPFMTYWGCNTSLGEWSSPKSIGLACNAYHSGAGTCGEPIDLGSGNVFDQVIDYETAGQNKLALIRYYNSMAATDTYATSMGPNWRTNYDRYLHIFTTGVVAERPDGQQIGFTSSSGTYTPDSDIDLKLTRSGSTYTLTDHDDTVETYTASGSKATLNSIKLRNGFTEALTYSSGQVSFVSDSYARQLGFTYSSGLLSGVTTPDSLTLSYGYLTFSSATRLSTVTYNTSPTTHQTYLYENTSFPGALTGITDENGNRYATWGYDANGRGILSQLSGAINYTSVYYNDTNGNRVVKGPLGIVETYKFATLQGVPKVREIDRAANSPVASASETFGYDSNGYLRSKNDWNGNNTTWVNNSHGQPTQITFASATTNAQTTNLTYDLSWPHLPHTISTNGLNANFTYDSSGNNLTRKLTDTTSTSLPYSTNGQTRTWTYTYNRTGEVLTAQLPRTDVTAKTTYAYAGGTTGGMLVSITDRRALACDQHQDGLGRFLSQEGQGPERGSDDAFLYPAQLAFFERHCDERRKPHHRLHL